MTEDGYRQVAERMMPDIPFPPPPNTHGNKNKQGTQRKQSHKKQAQGDKNHILGTPRTNTSGTKTTNRHNQQRKRAVTPPPKRPGERRKSRFANR